MSQTPPMIEDREVQVPISDTAALTGDLVIPAGAQGIVLFAHGSGSSRHSPRNRAVAATLRGASLGTLLIDLLTPDEEQVDQQTAELRFDVHMLAQRLMVVTDWLRRQPGTRGLRVGYFGASTGAAAALIAAAQQPQGVAAVVSRGGRPDLAADALDRVQAPTLLIVGGNDEPVVSWNHGALARLPVEKRLEVVPGATHLFAEPGALEQVARLASDWFVRHLIIAGPQDFQVLPPEDRKPTALR